jgi:hypothetical protein
MTVHPQARRMARFASRLPVLASGAYEIPNLLRDTEAWDIGFQLLDRMLAVGPQSAGFTRPIEPRVAAYRELVAA